jgi:signal transduction histidine kinase
MMGSSRKQGISIFVRILILFIAINILTSGVLIEISYIFSRKSTERRTKETISQQIATIRDNFEKQYGMNLKRTMRSLLSSSEVESYLFVSDAEKLIIRKGIERLFLQTVKDFESYHGISFVDANGDVHINVVGTSRLTEPVNFKAPAIAMDDAAHPPSLRAAIRLFNRLESTPLLLSSGYMEWFMPPREIQIEGPFLDEAGAVASLAGMAKLDLDTGTFGGVILIRQNLDAFFAYLRNVTFFDENVIWVYDAQGHVLQKPQNARATFNPSADLPQEFQGVTRLLDLPKGLVAFQDFSIIPGKTFIRIAVSIPSALLLKDLTPAIRFFSIVLLLSLLVVFLVALYVSSYLSRPIVELAQAAARLAKGDLSTQVEVQTTGEVQTLVESFNSMARDLRDTIASRDASVASLVTEVSERKRAEHELKQQATELEQARIVAEAANQAKSIFLANMSHELRTPLHGILGFARRGLKKATSASPEALHGYFTQINQSGEVLLTLLNDLLDLAKLEAGKMLFAFEPVSLHVILGSVADEFRSLIAERRLTVQYRASEDLPDVTIDQGKIMQVIRNLMSNAVKFSPSGGTITLSVQVEAESILVAVVDQGPGIPTAELDTVFDKFVQSSATMTGAGGTGLGLAICREILIAHDGHIWAENRPEGGARFCFTLPLHRPEEMHAIPVAVGDDRA